MRIVLLGAPGSGKGTQGALLAARHGIPAISTGDILRAEIADGSELGRGAQKFVDEGALVPDSLILDMMWARLQADDLDRGFILDGFPRSIPQAEGLSEQLGKLGRSLDAVVKLDLAKRTLLERMTARRICPSCGAVYNLLSRPPADNGICDACGTGLAQRTDDQEETVRWRLNVYEAQTAPLIDYYDARKLLLIVDADGSVDEVEERIEAALEGRQREPGSRGARP